MVRPQTRVLRGDGKQTFTWPDPPHPLKTSVPHPPILDIRNLRVDRGNTTILDNIHWRVEHRQHWVILGPNGSGKTTLLETLTGYTTPSDRVNETFGALADFP